MLKSICEWMTFSVGNIGGPKHYSNLQIGQMVKCVTINHENQANFKSFPLDLKTTLTGMQLSGTALGQTFVHIVDICRNLNCKDEFIFGSTITETDSPTYETDKKTGDFSKYYGALLCRLTRRRLFRRTMVEGFGISRRTSCDRIYYIFI